MYIIDAKNTDDYYNDFIYFSLSTKAEQESDSEDELLFGDEER